MDSPLISVVIPVYNAEKFLKQAIGSALEQTLTPHEVIIVDDGSTDSSCDIIAGFGSAVTLVSEGHRGLSGARNLGIAKSTGDWIAFLDADDYWLPDKLARQAASIQDDPTIGLVFTGRIELLPDGTTHEVPAREARWVRNMLPFQNHIFPSTVMVKRSLALQHPFDESLVSSEEWWFFYSLLRVTGFAAITEPKVIYRVSPNSLSNRDWKGVLYHAELVSRRILSDFTGPHKLLLGLRVNAKLLANASLSQREQGAPEYLSYMIKSLIYWPFPDFRLKRYKILLKMLLQKTGIQKV